MRAKDELSVDLNALRRKSGEAEQFLRSKFALKIIGRGGQLLISGGNAKNVKLALRKFLHLHDLDHYRVLNREGVLTVVLIEKEHVLMQRSTDVLPASDFTPDYFPGLSAFAATRFKTPHAHFGARAQGTGRREKLRVKTSRLRAGTRTKGN